MTPSPSWTLRGELPAHGVVRVEAPPGFPFETSSLVEALRAAGGPLRDAVVVERALTPSLWSSWRGRDRVDRVLYGCEGAVRRDLNALDVPDHAHLASLSASDRLLVALAALVARSEPLLLDGTGIDFRGAVRVCKLLYLHRRERLTLWVCDASVGVWADVPCLQGLVVRLVPREDVR